MRSGGVYASKTTSLKATKVHGQLRLPRWANRKACQMDLANAKVKAAIDSHRKKMGLYNKVYERLTREFELEDQAKAISEHQRVVPRARGRQAADLAARADQ